MLDAFDWFVRPQWTLLRIRRLNRKVNVTADDSQCLLVFVVARMLPVV